jgi:hypothetical protein
MMFIFLLAAGLCFLISEVKLRTALVALFIYIFTIFYSFTEGPVAFQYSAEVFPTVHREQGMAWAVSINLFFAGVLSLTFPPMVAAMGQIGAFCFYAGLNLVCPPPSELRWASLLTQCPQIAFFGIFCLVPETKGFTLEELDAVFSIPRDVFLRHQTRLWLPYMFKRYFLFQKGAVAPPPLVDTSDNTFNKVDSEEDTKRV